MTQVSQIRSSFLKAFVKSVIENVSTPDIESIRQEKKMIETIREKIKSGLDMPMTQEAMERLEIKEQLSPPSTLQQLKTIEKEYSSSLPIKQQFLPIPVPQSANPQLQRFLPPKIKRFLPSNQRQPTGNLIRPALRTPPSPLPMSQRPQENPIPSIKSAPAATEQITISSFSKIDSLLKDPAVQTVECPGPNKPILVYKSGVIQNTNITLLGDEINNIMKEISEKTRIPLMSGVFKAAFGEVIVTAVMSEFVGTRFIINKKQIA